jgi:hypothetical protein
MAEGRGSSGISFDSVLSFFILAVLANIAFCAAYPVDIFAQMSSFNVVWLKVRWFLLFIGLLFASIITRFMIMGFFINATT